MSVVTQDRPRGYLNLGKDQLAEGETEEMARDFQPHGFGGMADYIDAITYMIWEGRRPDLCMPYYAVELPVYTLAGQARTAQEVVNNTTNTLRAFPDRTLFPEGLIWSCESGERRRYHSSHLISTHMTNLGPSEYGAATSRSARIFVIAHCIIVDAVIIEEWLVRDNYGLCTQLGCDPVQIAKEWASAPIEPRHASWLHSEHTRVMANTPIEIKPPPQGIPAMIAVGLRQLWQTDDPLSIVTRLYHPHAVFLGPAGRDLVGHQRIAAHFAELRTMLPDLVFSLDCICANGSLGRSQAQQASDPFIAARWTIAGHHQGGGRWGEASGGPVVILAESHLQVRKGLIVRDTTVFDELSVMTQIERARKAVPGQDHVPHHA